jgi:flagellar hook-basal body complex protein FliE
MDTRGIDQMLSELRATSGLAAGKPTGAASGTSGADTDFGQVLKTAIDQVSSAQMQAQEMAQGFASGDSNVNLADVMVNLQKASLSFQQMVQVRNKLVTAYQDIMNMSV